MKQAGSTNYNFLSGIKEGKEGKMTHIIQI